MTDTTPNPRTSRLKRRRAARQAARRQRHWEDIRNPVTPPMGAATTATTGRPALLAPPAGRHGRRGIAQHASLAAGAALIVTGTVALLALASPVISGSWSFPWLLSAAALLVGGACVAAVAWRAATSTRAKAIAATLTVVLVAATVAGAFTQRVVEGRVQLRGSTTDRAAVELERARHAVEILADNQVLLGLPPEQAVPLGATFQAAIDQGAVIGRTWNPATFGPPPVDELADVVRLINLAALAQAAALEARYASLTNPEPGLVDVAEERAQTADDLINVEIPEALDVATNALSAKVTGR